MGKDASASLEREHSHGRHSRFRIASITCRGGNVVEEGKYACFETSETGGVLASIRPGEPRRDGVAGGWFGFADGPDVFSGEAVVVITATESGSEFSFNVTDVVDDPEDCQEERSPASADPCLIELCGPSDFYRLSLPDWLSRVLPPIDFRSQNRP